MNTLLMRIVQDTRIKDLVSFPTEQEEYGPGDKKAPACWSHEISERASTGNIREKRAR
jgi:hypothetical protein